MKRMLVLLATMWAIHAGAAVPYSDEMLTAIANKTHATKAEVIASLETGCASGITP